MVGEKTNFVVIIDFLFHFFLDKKNWIVVINIFIVHSLAETKKDVLVQKLAENIVV